MSPTTPESPSVRLVRVIHPLRRPRFPLTPPPSPPPSVAPLFPLCWPAPLLYHTLDVDRPPTPPTSISSLARSPPHTPPVPGSLLPLPTFPWSAHTQSRTRRTRHVTSLLSLLRTTPLASHSATVGACVHVRALIRLHSSRACSCACVFQGHLATDAAHATRRRASLCLCRVCVRVLVRARGLVGTGARDRGQRARVRVRVRAFTR